jgi:hypothetical protein
LGRVEAEGFEVQDWIADQLSWPVERDGATPVALYKVGTQRAYFKGI